MKWTLKVITPFLLIIVGLVFENVFNDGIYDKWVKPILHFKIELYLILLIGYFILILISSYRHNNEQKINSLESEINQYKDDLKQETKGLWKQFHDLNRFNQQEIINKTMKTFVDSDNNVMAIQLYDYIYKEGSKNTVIKVTHQDGYVAEGETLNALLQEHYTINNKIYKRYKNAMVSIGRNNGIKLLKFINDYKTQLDNISADGLKGKVTYSIYYSLLLLGVHKYIFFYTNERTYSTYAVDILQDHEKEKILNDNKRTGLFRGILNRELVGEENYIFLHIGDNVKKGRIYFTKGVKINGKKCVFLITLFNNLNQDEILNKVNQMSSTFVDLLINNGVNVDLNN